MPENVVEVNTARSGQPVPAGASWYRVRGRAGGGAGGRGRVQSFVSNGGGGGGGGGAYFDTGWRPVSELGPDYSVTRGLGGSTTGASGGATTFTSGTITLTAGGGIGGTIATSASQLTPGGAGGTVTANIALAYSENGGTGGAGGESASGIRDGKPGANTNLAGPGGGGGAFHPNAFNTDRGGNGGDSSAAQGGEQAGNPSGLEGNPGEWATTGNAGGGGGGGGINGGNARSGAAGGVSGAGGGAGSGGTGGGTSNGGVGAQGETIVEFMFPNAGGGSGGFSFGGSGAGVKVAAGVAAGAFLFAGVAAGDNPGAGSASSAYGFAGAASGVRAPVGAGSGGYGFGGSGAGEKPQRGAAAGGYSFTGSGAGQKAPAGAGAGGYLFAGSAGGLQPILEDREGGVDGAYGFAGSASGSRYLAGGAAGGYQFDATAAGTTDRSGSASSAYAFDGTATGGVPRNGAAAGAFTFASSTGAGVKPSRGSAAGAYAFTGNASGPGVVLFPAATVGSMVGLNFNLPWFGIPADYMPIALQGVLAEPPFVMEHIHYPASTDDDSIEAGVESFDDWVRNTPGRKIGFAHSQGCQAMTRWMERYRNDPTAPTADDLMFVLIGNLCRSNGAGNGVGKPAVDGIPITATPTDTRWRIIDFARRYDGWADWPNRATGIAKTNATRGMSTHHMHYEDADLFAEDNTITSDGNTVYVTTQEEHLPYLDTVLFGNQVPDVVVEQWRDTIEDAYDTHGAPDPIEPPEPSSLWWRLVLSFTNA